MKKNRFTIPAVFMIVLTVSICTYAQDSIEVVILSTKVGEVIDLSEREYYHLFPAIQNFISAAIAKLPNGKYEARFTTGSSTDQKFISVEMPEVLIFSLAEKIEYFDEIKDGSYVAGTHHPAIQVGGKMVKMEDGKASEYESGLQTPQMTSGGIKQNKEGNTIVVITRRGELYRGRILCVTDSVLVVWRSTEFYNAQGLNTLAVPLPFFEIERVVIEKEGHFLSGLGTGLLVGGGIGAIIGFASGDDKPGLMSFTAGEKAALLGILLGIPGAVIGGISGAVQDIDDDFIIGGDSQKYRAILLDLIRNAIFYSLLPTELQVFLMKTKENFPSHAVEFVTISNKSAQESLIKRFHLSLGGAWVSTSANNDIMQAFNSSGFGGRRENWLFGGSIDYPKDNSMPISWWIGLEYNVNDHARLGFALSNLPKQEIEGIDAQCENTSGTSYSLFLEYVFEPSYVSTSEFAIAAGPSYNTLYVNATMFPSGLNVKIFTMKKNVIGLYARTSYDYYVSRNFSLQFKIEGRIMPKIDVPEVNFSNSLAVTTLKQHSIDFSEVGFSFGVRFHL